MGHRYTFTLQLREPGSVGTVVTVALDGNVVRIARSDGAVIATLLGSVDERLTKALVQAGVAFDSSFRKVPLRITHDDEGGGFGGQPRSRRVWRYCVSSCRLSPT